MDLFFLALNLIVIAITGLGVLVVRTRGHRRAEARLPTSIRPDRGGDELSDAIDEWARATGILTAESPGRSRTDSIWTDKVGRRSSH